MLNSNLRAVGGSVMVAVPKAMLETLGFTANMPVSLSIEGEKLVISRKKRNKYTLDQLLARCDLTLPLSAEEKEWMDAPLVGKEII